MLTECVQQGAIWWYCEKYYKKSHLSHASVYSPMEVTDLNMSTAFLH